MNELRSRHLAIMDALLAYPEKKNKELAEMLGYTESRFSTIVNQPMFKLAFKEYRARYETGLQKAIAEVTVSALKASQEIIEDKGLMVADRQTSIRDVLNLGHARAVDRKATLALEAEIPKEAFGMLTGLMKELEKPFEPTRLLEKRNDGPEEREVFEAEQVIQTG